ncbi:MAG: MarR family transcriptional regulator [Actinobacteria bacterium]|jgi:DNA-binding MarR family transcriptional regulator|nr:MarR family transcriptional regulator [Actinomycetota bacterium]
MAKDNWTFLSNHGHVLIYISQEPEARISDIARSVGITERRTQGIISDLESAGYLEVVRVGRRNTYLIKKNLRFRHPAEAHRSIGSLIKIFSK